MNIKVIMVGKNKSSAFDMLIRDFTKRLSLFCHLQMLFVKDEMMHGDQKKCLNKEADRIIQLLSPDDFVMVLDERGHLMSSIQFSVYFKRLQQQAIRSLVFIIGGAYGLHETVKKRADFLFSLSALTMSHQLVRLVLLEQLYRIFTLQRGMKYPK